MDIEHILLPGHAYIPGHNKRHAEGFLDHVKQLALPETRDETAAQNGAWLYSLKLLREGFFWESHEVLETVWLNALPNSKERCLVQGVIHLANAGVKFRMGRSNAADRLLKLAEGCFREAFPGKQPSPLMLLERDQMGTLLSSEKTMAHE